MKSTLQLHYFDYRTAAAEARIPARDLRAVERLVRQEFPKDRMMFELHVLRACHAVRDGHLKLRDVLGPQHAHTRK